MTMAEGALRAARKALASSSFAPADIGMLIYGGVCRDQLEPATACAVASGLGLSSKTRIYDVSNACLGVMDGIVQVADAIELGYIRAGMVVSCESARDIVDQTIEKMLRQRDMETLKLSLATLTGGSGAIAVIVCRADMAPNGHAVVGGTIRSRAEFHDLCQWGPAIGMAPTGSGSAVPMNMRTDPTALMEHGVELGIETWFAFLEEMGWRAEQIDRTICHQVGAPHRDTVLRKLGLSVERDFQTFEFLGNIGTVSLPITAAIAEDRGFLCKGHRVVFCGIGSGLNCLMLGVQW